MSKKKKYNPQSAVPDKTQTVASVSEKAKPAADWSMTGFRFQAVFLAFLGFLFYANTIGNGSAFDDRLVIINNEYVQSGLAGIPKILTGESYESFSKKQNMGNPLSGGRYRPLSIVTFAVEQQFLGLPDPAGTEQKLTAESQKKLREKQENDMHPRHFVNVALYLLLCVVLLYLFRNMIFPGNPVAAFMATLLFLIHPIHTEVVANVKSRDELLSLLFIAATLIFAFQFQTEGKKRNRTLAFATFFLALLAKEYAVMLIILLPVFLYVTHGGTIKLLFSTIAPYCIPLGIYLALRFMSVGAASPNADAEIMNNPYLYATASGKWASIILVLLRYVGLLLWPAHLSADYSFRQLPYASFANPAVWVSIGFYIAVMVAGIYLILKRHTLGFAIACYLLFLAPVCNIFLNVGAPMGERLVFHSSVGVALTAGWLLGKAWERMATLPAGKYGIAAVVTVLVVLADFKTIARNRDWQSDATLFLRDVQTCPNSIITNCNAGAAMLDKADLTNDPAAKKRALDSGMNYLSKAIALHPKYILAYINRGLIYVHLNDFDKALADCDTINKYNPQNPAAAYLCYAVSDHYFQLGMSNGRSGNATQAIENFRMGTRALPSDADLWYNLGYAYFTANRPDEAYKAFARALSIRPNHPQARNMINQLQKNRPAGQ